MISRCAFLFHPFILQCRSKCGLFIAYLAAFGSIAGSVAILVASKQASGGDLHVGVVSWGHMGPCRMESH